MAVYQHYALIDPRIDDPIQRVRYIGRTERALTKRFREHLARVQYLDRSHCGNWIRQLLRLGLEPILLPLGEGDANREAELIVKWRARGADLTNNTAGGEGAKGCVWTDEQRARAVVRAQEVAARPGWKEKVAEATRRALSSPEMRAKITAGLNARLEDPIKMEKRRAISRATRLRPDVRAKIDGAEARPRRAEQCRISMHTEEVRAKAKAGIQAKHADPEAAKGYADRMREVTQNPEFIKKRTATYSETYRSRREADPENKQIAAWYQDGISKAEIARRLDWAYKKIVKRVLTLKKDGVM